MAMEMAAAAMPEGATPPSPLRPPAPPLRSSSPTASLPSGEVHGETPASGKIHGEPQEAGDVRRGEQEASRVLIRMKQETDEACGDPKLSGDVRGERQVTGEARVEQRDSSEVPRMPPSSKKKSKKKTEVQEEMHPTAGSKRPLSDAGGSSRAIKAAKLISEKVVLKQLQNKSVGRKISPIVSGSSYDKHDGKTKGAITCKISKFSWDFEVPFFT